MKSCTTVQIHYKEVTTMTKYRETIRLTGLGFSQRNIIASCGVAQKTVVKVQKRARELRLEWPLDETKIDIVIEKLLFPKEEKTSSNKRMYFQFCYHIQHDEQKHRATMPEKKYKKH